MKTCTIFALVCLSWLAPSMFGQTNAIADNQSTNSQPSAADLQQAVLAYQQSPSEATAGKVIRLATAMDQAPPIPEEARKHFVRGATLMKVAKSTDDFQQASIELLQAARIAPWWPDARYDLALAREAAGNYAPAIVDVRLYQLFKLTEADARTAQDKIYALEIEQENAVKEAQVAAQKQAEEATAKANAEAAAARQRQVEEAKRNSFEGTWAESSGNQKIIIARNASGTYFVNEEIAGSNYQDRNIRVNGRNIRFIRDDRGFQLDFDLTLSADGQGLTGAYDFLGTATAGSWKRGDSWRTTASEFRRQ